MHVTLTCAKWTCPPTADGVSFGKQVRIISGECRSVSNEEMVVSVLKTSIFRRGNDLFSDEDNCDARIKNRIRSSNSRARSGNDRIGMINDCGGGGNYLEIPPVFGPLTLRWLTTVLWQHPQRVFAVYTAQFLCCESHLLQGRGDVGAVAERIVCTKHNLRGAHEHFERLDVHGIG